MSENNGAGAVTVFLEDKLFELKGLEDQFEWVSHGEPVVEVQVAERTVPLPQVGPEHVLEIYPDEYEIISNDELRRGVV